MLALASCLEKLFLLASTVIAFRTLMNRPGPPSGVRLPPSFTAEHLARWASQNIHELLRRAHDRTLADDLDRTSLTGLLARAPTGGLIGIPSELLMTRDQFGLLASVLDILVPEAYAHVKRVHVLNYRTEDTLLCFPHFPRVNYLHMPDTTSLATLEEYQRQGELLQVSAYPLPKPVFTFVPPRPERFAKVVAHNPEAAADAMDIPEQGDEPQRTKRPRMDERA